MWEPEHLAMLRAPTAFTGITLPLLFYGLSVKYNIHILFLIFEFVSRKIVDFWDMMPCNLVSEAAAASIF
jgi:hypothetical protein